MFAWLALWLIIIKVTEKCNQNESHYWNNKKIKYKTVFFFLLNSEPHIDQLKN